jgi:hypothetical protein
MKFETALKYYRTSRAMARAAGVTDQAVGQWKKRGIVPLWPASCFESKTKGKLKVDLRVYARSAAKAEPAGPARV